MIPFGATARRRSGSREGGQVLVLVVFGMVAIMAGAGLAFDVGRFYSERRFLQNAADAGALAIANALIRGESNADAEAEGRDILTRNLLGSPTGSTATV
ncbi:MAG TPA: pilus assembly protein TadG-related protein, partial [Candidatus Saccharimonadales bacterium]|nr:pilus assembly protein TadG-related protein [Candidatus Saccharimonadales bacterium]